MKWRLTLHLQNPQDSGHDVSTATGALATSGLAKAASPRRVPCTASSDAEIPHERSVQSAGQAISVQMVLILTRQWTLVHFRKKEKARAKK